MDSKILHVLVGLDDWAWPQLAEVPLPEIGPHLAPCPPQPDGLVVLLGVSVPLSEEHGWLLVFHGSLRPLKHKKIILKMNGLVTMHSYVTLMCIFQ